MRRQVRTSVRELSMRLHLVAGRQAGRRAGQGGKERLSERLLQVWWQVHALPGDGLEHILSF